MEEEEYVRALERLVQEYQSLFSEYGNLYHRGAAWTWIEQGQRLHERATVLLHSEKEGDNERDKARSRKFEATHLYEER